VIEDADRLNDFSGNALLKALEEPTPQTVWVLCAPSIADVLPTIASRTRHVSLRTPSTANVAQLLVDSYGVDPSLASLAARASQGHIGRARALATDDDARIRRQRDLRVPFQLRDLASCVAMAGDIAEASKDAANSHADGLDAAEIDLLKRRYYAEGVTKLEKSLRRSYEAELRDLEKEQKRRRTRMIKDEVDRSLIDLQSLFRDVLILQLGAEIELINEELRPGVQQLAGMGTTADTVRRLGALEHARRAVTSGVTVESVLESLMVELKDPWVRVGA
jgi:DNA polymerase-3 subunit delta'